MLSEQMGTVCLILRLRSSRFAQKPEARWFVFASISLAITILI